MQRAFGDEGPQRGEALTHTRAAQEVAGLLACAVWHDNNRDVAATLRLPRRQCGHISRTAQNNAQE